MLYGLIAEDGSILKSVPILVSRLVDLQGEAIECRRMNGKSDFIANFWKILKEFRFRFPTIQKVLAVCDADSDCVVTLAELLRERARAHLGTFPFPLVLHVIKRELETWWIAEPSAISTVVGMTIPFPGGNVEQSVLDPKTFIVQRLAPAKRVYTPGDAAEIAQIIDLTVLRDRCPGFVRFERRVV